MTEAQIAEKQAILIAANKARIREVLDEQLPDTAHAIVHGEGVAFGRGTKDMKPDA